MRWIRLALLGLPASLQGCGHPRPATPTLSVSCGGSLALAGAASIDVVAGSDGHGVALNFADPANPGHAGTLPVLPGRPCTITPASDSGGPATGHDAG